VKREPGGNTGWWGEGEIKFYLDGRSDLRVAIQPLGWRSDGRYLPLQHDISSVAFWYHPLPREIREHRQR
jgi:hypothetical protein